MAPEEKATAADEAKGTAETKSPPAKPKKAKAPEPDEAETESEEEEAKTTSAPKKGTPEAEAEEEEGEEPEEVTKAEPGKPTPKKSDARRRAEKKEADEAAAKAKKEAAKEKLPPAPRRPKLSPEVSRLLTIRRAQDDRRPRFIRQASYRYWSIGRWGTWRHPRGMQSKQRRHYGYRSQVVSVGFGSPSAVRGLTPSGFRPVVVHTLGEVDSLDASRDAAVIARTVGTRRRLTLEEHARRKGLHVLNPIVEEREE